MIATALALSLPLAELVSPLRHLAQLGWLAAALPVAALSFARRGGAPEHALRFVLSLGLAALACHLGWALLHPEHAALVLAHPLRPAGFSVLFAPLGPLALLPPDRRERLRFAAPALGALPLALASARVGCLVAGCCHGVTTRFGAVPTQGLEIAGCLALAAGSARLPARQVPGAVLGGLGAIRLAVDPLRAADPMGAPLIPAATIAVVWLLAGALLLLRVRAGWEAA